MASLHSTHWRSACQCCSEPPTAWQEEGAAGQNVEGALAPAGGTGTGGNGRQQLTATGSLRRTAPRDQRRVALFIMFRLPGGGLERGRGQSAGVAAAAGLTARPAGSLGNNCARRNVQATLSRPATAAAAVGASRRQRRRHGGLGRPGPPIAGI